MSTSEDTAFAPSLRRLDNRQAAASLPHVSGELIGSSTTSLQLPSSHRKKINSMHSPTGTSRTISVQVLQWSLSRAMKLGFFTSRVFTREIKK